MAAQVIRYNKSKLFFNTINFLVKNNNCMANVHLISDLLVKFYLQRKILNCPPSDCGFSDML